MTRPLHFAIAISLAVGSALVAAGCERSTGAPVPVGASTSHAPWASDTAARAPSEVRVRVQVLNGSGRNGMARRATQQLRDFGYDVVDYGSRGDSTRVTEVQVTAADKAWGERVVKALRSGVVRERDGTLGYVDVVVLLGRDWQPAPQPLRP
jgi:hypothetical protein